MTQDEYTLPANVIDPRPGDVIAASLDGATWRVIIVDEVVNLRRLVPFGERGARSFLSEDLTLDSVAPAWTGVVHLLVRLHTEVFTSLHAAQEAASAGQLGTAIAGVCIEGSLLTVSTAQIMPGSRAP